MAKPSKNRLGKFDHFDVEVWTLNTFRMFDADDPDSITARYTVKTMRQLIRLLSSINDYDQTAEVTIREAFMGRMPRILNSGIVGEVLSQC